MPFGLTNAPATFMIYMDDLLWPFIGKCVIVYLDDILIFSRSWEENVKRCRQAFDTLQQHWLYLNMDKFSFSMTNIKYLGYVINSVGIHVDIEKVYILKYFPIPFNQVIQWPCDMTEAKYESSIEISQTKKILNSWMF